MKAHHTNLPERLALFPLEGAVLLPRSKLPLNIFEPRYLQLVEDALKTDHRLIGMIQPDTDGLCAIGTAGRIVSFAECDDNRLMIELQSASRFRLSSVEDGFAPYQCARVTWDEFSADLKGPESDDDLNRTAFIDLLMRYAESAEIEANWTAAAKAPDELLINTMSMLLPFKPEERQALLECATLQERRMLLESLIEFAFHSRAGGPNLQ